MLQKWPHTAWFFVLSSLAFAFSSSAQDKSPQADSTPGVGLSVEWFGTWAGEVKTHSVSGKEQSFQMQLSIGPTDIKNRFQWKTEYDGERGKSTRDYWLVKCDASTNEFIIDEQNGVRINATMLGNSLSSNFVADGHRIWTTYRLHGTDADREIHFELFDADEAVSTESAELASVPQVVSLKPKVRQFAKLRLAKATPNANATALPSWKKLETEPYRGKQDDICFVNENVGWYVNGAGKIFRTLDGGFQWTEQLNQPGTFFRCIAFIDERHGFAGNIGPDYFPNVSDSVPLYETTDGGVTWKPVSTIEGEPVVGLCALQVLREEFINAGKLETRIRLIGVGRVGGPVAMIFSDDLGATWQQIQIKDHAAMALDVHFINRDVGFIAAATNTDVAQSNALILSTTDRGATWTKAWQSSRPYELTWKMSFPTREIGYVTIQSYNPDPMVTERFVAKTVDGGKTWMEVPLVSNAKVREFGIGFVDERTGWVGATPTGFQTTDGGVTWREVEMGNAVNKIRLLKTESKTVGFAIGLNVYRIDIPMK